MEQHDKNDCDQRDDKGRFAKGNRLATGNPFARQTAKLRQAALAAVSDEDIRDIIDALKLKATGGDVPAAKLLLSYTLGKPERVVDPDTLDQHEFKTILDSHLPSPESVTGIVHGMPLEAMLPAMKAVLPARVEEKIEQAVAVLTQKPEAEDDDDDDDDSVDEKNESDKETEELLVKMKQLLGELTAMKNSPEGLTEAKASEAMRRILGKPPPSPNGENGAPLGERCGVSPPCVPGAAPSANGKNGVVHV